MTLINNFKQKLDSFNFGYYLKKENFNLFMANRNIFLSYDEVEKEGILILHKRSKRGKKLNKVVELLYLIKLIFF